MNGELTAFFRSALHAPSLDVVVAPDFGSGATDYRTRLRRALFERLRELGFEPHYSGVLALGAPPHCQGVQISVSHSETLGGFMISQSATRLGFDIEASGRVSQQSAARISSTDKVIAAPSPTAAWAAQEAAFKALNLLFPIKTQSEVTVSDWEVLPTGGYQFRAAITPPSTTIAPTASVGVLIEIKGLIFAGFSVIA